MKEMGWAGFKVTEKRKRERGLNARNLAFGEILNWCSRVQNGTVPVRCHPTLVAEFFYRGYFGQPWNNMLQNCQMCTLLCAQKSGRRILLSRIFRATMEQYAAKLSDVHTSLFVYGIHSHDSFHMPMERM